MADIDVVPRRKTPAWVWVIVALIIIAIVWAIAASHTATRATSELLTLPHAPGLSPAHQAFRFLA